MTEQLERFITLLKGIFELDKSDLDFGIYRIMNIRKKEIEKFLAEGLPARVKDALAPFAGNTSDIEKRIAEIEKQCDIVGIEVANSKMAGEYNELKATLAKGVDLSGLEADVYSQLYSFFNRYYEEGDFISKRRYKEGVYAIPYEGEEVKLYWANQDQYYIKTSENFKDYTFVAEGYNIHFRLVDATTEQNNNKESKDNKRVFMLYTEDPERPDLKTFEFDAEKKELIIRFVFDIPEDKKAKYEELNDKAITTWLIGNCQELVTVLLVNISSDPKKPLNLLQKHLRSYVAKNTFDYFIHKDLKKFLSRELDFFIKNEVMHLDDVDTTDEKRVDTWLAKVRAIKRVGKVIIDFLSSIEDFQKKLWLKKKFVVQCDYCITLDRVPEKFHKEIAQNINQWQEWEKLGFFRLAYDPAQADQLVIKFDEPGINDFLVFLSSGRIEEIKVTDTNCDLSTYLFDVSDFFRQFKYLLVDTKFFNQNFKEKLLACIDNFDEKCNGLMLHSENFQALSCLQKRFHEKIQEIYIDPPFNLKHNGEYLYRTDYKDSTWLSLLYDRIVRSRILLNRKGLFLLRCDTNGNALVKNVCNSIFGIDNFESELLVQRIRKNVTGQGKISLPLANDSLFVYMNSTEAVFCNPYKKLPSTRDEYWRRIDDSAGFRNPPERIIFGKKFSPYKRDAHFKFSQASIESMIEEGRIRLICKNCRYEHYQGIWQKCPACGSVDCTPQYKVLSSDEVVLDSNWLDIAGYSSKWNFSTENSLVLLKRALQIGSKKSSIILDFFAGSGTTAHAAIDLNRNDAGSRKYIVVDMGEHFDTVLKPRIEKVVFSADWKDGKPVAITPDPKKKSSTKTLGLDLGKDSLGFALVEDGELTDISTVKMANPYNGISHCFKYMRLESYEDALSNVALPDEANVNRLTSLFGEEYLIKYMLDLDTAGSVLNLAAFKDPFDYKLKVTEKNETKEVNADLMETFNYLIGLTVDKMYARKIFSATPDPAGEYDGAVKLTGNDNGEYIFRQIEGTLPSGERALIIWRNITDNLLESNAALDAYFLRYRINPADREFDMIFVNGDNNIANLKNTEETWKVRMIEPEFKARMFEEE